jgi:hypothetical protein
LKKKKKKIKAIETHFVEHKNNDDGESKSKQFLSELLVYNEFLEPLLTSKDFNYSSRITVS